MPTVSRVWFAVRIEILTFPPRLTRNRFALATSLVFGAYRPIGTVVEATFTALCGATDRIRLRIK